jgi:inositol oxygenase
MTDIIVEPQQKDHQYRNYVDSERQSTVAKFYATKYKNQTVQYNVDIRKRYAAFDKKKMTIWDALEFLNTVTDDSDPDISAAQIIHCYQTAEACRKLVKDDPALDWFPLVGLIHDLGKVLACPEWGGLPQEAVVGDIYPVGCQFDLAANVLAGFEANPDFHDERYNSKFGIYSEHCGFDKLLMSFGHDEYLYQVLKNHPECKIPEEGLFLIRFHSFYPWHNKGGYTHLASESDMKMLPLVKKFQSCDLYSKIDEEATEQMKPGGALEKYYKALAEKYCPGVVSW